MSYERAVCPFCGRSISLPDGRFNWHIASAGTTCQGSSQSQEDARLLSLDPDELEATVRVALPDGPALAAFEDLLARAELDRAQAW